MIKGKPIAMVQYQDRLVVLTDRGVYVIDPHHDWTIELMTMIREI